MYDVFGTDFATKKLFFQYVNKFGFQKKHVEKWSEEEITRFLELIIQEYFNHQLGLDEFSLLCEKLWGILLQTDKSGEGAAPDVVALLLLASDLEWEVRHDPDRAAHTLKKLVHFNIVRNKQKETPTSSQGQLSISNSSR